MRLRRIRHRVASVLRLVIALSALATVGFVAVRAVGRVEKDVEARILEDRGHLVRGFAAGIATWLDAGLREAEELADGTTAGTPAVSIAGAAPGLHGFAVAAFHIDAAGIVQAATPTLGGLVERRARPCIVSTGSGRRVEDARMLDAARAAPALSGFAAVPGDCGSTGVAASAPAGGGAIVVVSTITEGVKRFVAAEALGAMEGGGARAYLIDPAGAALVSGPALADAPARLAVFDDITATKVLRYPLGEDGVEVVGAAAPVPGHAGWRFVVEQDTATFGLTNPVERGGVRTAVILTAAFAVVLLALTVSDLRRQRAQRRTDEAKNAFFSVTGHELRTPLTSIKGFVETLSTRWEGLDDEARRALLERMLPATRRLERVVDRLLVAASIQAETYTLPRADPLDAAAALELAVARFRPEAPLHTFEVVVAPATPPVLADAKALGQVLAHLIDNAVKYSPAGGVVRLGAEASRRGVTITVDDEGIGLPADRRRLFEDFTQAESVTGRVHDEGGVGVGLYIVARLTEQMGGRVRAEDRVDGVGARFRVDLPSAGGTKGRTGA